MKEIEEYWPSDLSTDPHADWEMIEDEEVKEAKDAEKAEETEETEEANEAPEMSLVLR
jgi:hypothetical protein